MIQISKIIIIIIIIIFFKKKIKRGQNGRRGGSVERERLRGFYFFISFFVSFSDLWKLDRRFSSRLKAKLIHATRATCGYQNLRVSSNSMR